MAMVLGILQVEITIDGATSLKDKRRVVSSVKDRLHNDFKVSVAEVGEHDVHQTAVLGIALAATDVRHCQSVLDNILNRLRDQRGFYLSNHSTEILTGHASTR